MADPNVKLQFTANSQQAEASLARLERRLRKLEARGKHGRGGPGNRMAQQFDKAAVAVQRFGRAMLGLNGVQSVISQITQGIEDLRQAQHRAAQENVTFAGAFAQAAFNLGKDTSLLTPKERQQFQQGAPAEQGFLQRQALSRTIDQIQEKTKADKRDVAIALSEAFSGASVSAKKATNAAQQSLITTRDFPAEDRGEIAGAILDVQKANPKASSAGSLAFISELGTSARITDLGKLAKNVIGPTVALSLGDQGDTSLKTAGSLVATISQFMVDKFGRRSGTASIQIARRIKEVVRKIPEEKLPEDVRGIEDPLLKRIRAVQQSPELQAQLGKQIEAAVGNLQPGSGQVFLKGRFSVKARDTIEQLLAGDNKVASTFNRIHKFLPDPKSQEAEKRLQFMNSLILNHPSSQVAHFQRLLRSGTNDIALSDQQKALMGTFKEEGISGLIQQAGLAGISGRIDRARIATRYYLKTSLLGENPIQAGIEELKFAKQILETSESVGVDQGSHPDKLDEMIGELKEIRQTMQEQKNRPQRNPAVPEP